jgi:hypothetical protein
MNSEVTPRDLNEIILSGERSLYPIAWKPLINAPSIPMISWIQVHH